MSGTTPSVPGAAGGCVVVVCGGDPPPAAARDLVPPGSLVIAADSGAAHAVALGLPVHMVVGDMDSVERSLLGELERAGAEVERHPVAKDSTDLELALARAVALGASEVVVLGGYGGRLDHLLGNLLVLTSPVLAGVRVSAHMGEATLHVVRDRVEWQGDPGDVVTLFAVGGKAAGVQTEGLRYALHGEELHPGSTRGVSNEQVSHSAAVSVADGVVLVLRPFTGRPGIT